MKKIVAAFGVLALSVAVSAPALAGAGYLKKDQPQAELSQGDGLFPGGHGGGGFGVSERHSRRQWEHGSVRHQRQSGQRQREPACRQC